MRQQTLIEGRTVELQSHMTISEARAVDIEGQEAI